MPQPLRFKKDILQRIQQCPISPTNGSVGQLKQSEVPSMDCNDAMQMLVVPSSDSRIKQSLGVSSEFRNK